MKHYPPISTDTEILEPPSQLSLFVKDITETPNLSAEAFLLRANQIPNFDVRQKLRAPWNIRSDNVVEAMIESGNYALFEWILHYYSSLQLDRITRIGKGTILQHLVDNPYIDLNEKLAFSRVVLSESTHSVNLITQTKDETPLTILWKAKKYLCLTQ